MEVMAQAKFEAKWSCQKQYCKPIALTEVPIDVPYLFLIRETYANCNLLK